MLKEHVYSEDCWRTYTNKVKEILGRKITKEEVKIVMQGYLKKTNVDKVVLDLK